METGKLAFINVRDLFDAQGNLIPVAELDPEISAAIVSIEFEEIYSGRGEERKVIGRTAKVKLADKYRGLPALLPVLCLDSSLARMLRRDEPSRDRRSSPSHPRVTRAAIGGSSRFFVQGAPCIKGL